MYLVPLNCTDGKSCVVCILPKLFKKKKKGRGELGRGERKKTHAMDQTHSSELPGLTEHWPEVVGTQSPP